MDETPTKIMIVGKGHDPADLRKIVQALEKAGAEVVVCDDYRGIPEISVPTLDLKSIIKRMPEPASEDAKIKDKYYHQSPAFKRRDYKKR